MPVGRHGREPEQTAVPMERASTPEEQKKRCLNCDNMADFIKGLQGEIKRLQVSLNNGSHSFIGPYQRPANAINSSRGLAAASDSAGQGTI